MPGNEMWAQFPVLAVVALSVSLLFGALFVFAKWVWGEMKTEQATDRAWREQQNKLREQAMAEQNGLWRTAMAERDLRWEASEKDRTGTLKEMTGMLDRMLTMLVEHDAQAKEIKMRVEGVEKELARAVDKNIGRAAERRGNGS